jgi:hypothetical protein
VPTFADPIDTESPSASPTPTESPKARASAKESHLGGLLVLALVLVVLLGAGGAIGLYLTREPSEL